MTTVYIDKRCGLAMTDSRVTSTIERAFLGIFPLQSKNQYSKVLQKSMYIHDRLFLSCGTVSEINKVLRYLVEQKPIVPSRKDGCHCLLLDKEYCINFVIHNGVLKKFVQFIDKNYVFSMGSGSSHMRNTFNDIGSLKLNNMSLSEYVIDEFSKVSEKDIYTDNNINLYKI